MVIFLDGMLVYFFLGRLFIIGKVNRGEFFVGYRGKDGDCIRDFVNYIRL